MIVQNLTHAQREIRNSILIKKQIGITFQDYYNESYSDYSYLDASHW